MYLEIASTGLNDISKAAPSAPPDHDTPCGAGNPSKLCGDFTFFCGAISGVMLIEPSRYRLGF